MSRRTLQSIIAAKGYALTSYISMPGGLGAELYARQGWDAITLDLQHGVLSYESMIVILQAIAAVDVVPLARVPWLDPSGIGRVLDAGVLGIACPMINTEEDAKALVRYSKYAPKGERSLGPLRAAILDGDGYARTANDRVAVLAMIETAEALSNLDAILGVEGIDGIYVGPGDLAVSMGVEPRMEGYDPQIERALDRISERCAAVGAIAGILAPNPAAAGRMLQRGFRFITLSTDTRALVAQASAWVTGTRAEAARVLA